jgi:hypothetical protein
MMSLIVSQKSFVKLKAYIVGGTPSIVRLCIDFSRWRQEQHIELLWTGPSPASQIPARRIDQVLYDLIESAKRDILLVTFAAHKISRLTDGLVRALNRGVQVRLILEFEEASQGQLSMDALNAFPVVICQKAQLYYWRACLAATEERYDVALIFCAKAVALDPRHLPTRLLVAQIHDYGLHDVSAAVTAYGKVITLAGYDGDNPYCAAAREALDNLVSPRQIPVETSA